MQHDLMNPEIVPPTDDKGHSAKITVRIQPDWVKQIDISVKHNGLLYNNRGDFIRDAILKHFEWINSWTRDQDDEITGSIWGQIRLAMDLFEQDRYQQGFAGLMTSLRERVNVFLRRGVKVEAVRHVLQTVNTLKNMTDGYWRNTHLTAVLEEYKELLNASDKVSLVKLITQEVEDSVSEMEEDI